MRINVRFTENNDTFGGVRESNEQIGVGFGEVQTATENDYERLINKPTINSVELVGALSAEELGLGRVYYDTSEAWNSQRTLVGIRGAVYIYSDYEWIEDQSGNQIPIAGIKIGDGNAYLIDAPFVTDAMTYAITRHVADTSLHVSPQEREFWNYKVSAFVDHQDMEKLVLSQTQYEKNGEIHTHNI